MRNDAKGAKYISYLLIIVMGILSPHAYAQDDSQATLTIQQLEPQQEEPQQEAGASARDGLSSLLFTYWEQVSIQEARNSRGLTRAPSELDLNEDLNSQPEEKIKPPPEERDIRLSGIVYNSKNDWTIWLNGRRVTPKALPPEVMDLKVYKGYIELEWFDDYSNNIFPIRLRPHQRFNIDTRIFLPG